MWMHVRRVIVGALAALVLLCATTAHAQTDFGLIRPMPWREVEALVEIWCPTSDAATWSEIEKAYRDALVEHDRLRGDALAKGIERSLRDHEERASAEEREKTVIEAQRHAARAIAVDEAFARALTDALEKRLPEAERGRSRPIALLLELRRAANQTWIESASGPYAVLKAATTRFDEPDATVVREVVTQALDRALPHSRVLADATREFERVTVRRQAEWTERFGGERPDADAIRTFYAERGFAHASLDARVAKSLPALERGSFEPFIAVDSGALARMTPKNARRLAFILADTDSMMGSYPGMVAGAEWRLRQVEKAALLTEAEVKDLEARLEAARTKDVERIRARIRVLIDLAERIGRFREARNQGDFNLSNDESNAAWQAIDAQDSGDVREIMVTLRRAMRESASVDWAAVSAAVVQPEESMWLVDPDAEWRSEGGLSPEPWTPRVVRSSDVEALSRRLQRGEPPSLPSVEPIASDELKGMWSPISDDEAAALRQRLVDRVQKARAEQWAAIQGIATPELCAGQEDLCRVWSSAMAVDGPSALLGRRAVFGVEFDEWQDRAGNPGLALLETSLAPDVEAKAIAALAPVMDELRLADEALLGVELFAEIDWLRANAAFSHALIEGGHALEVRLAAGATYEKAERRIAESLEAPVARRTAATRKAMEAMRAVLAPAEFERVRRSMRRSTFPGIDRERDRFEAPALRAMSLTTLDEPRQNALIALMADWSESFERRTERMAEAGPVTQFSVGGESAEQIVRRMTVDWNDYARRQEGLVFLSALKRLLAPAEAAEVFRGRGG
ncbi:MAG: hypothetical protein JNM94_04455 [Phycisphaerae bacterium]|nr:hypothetical protein [Phycisphaerae bacterium]